MAEISLPFEDTDVSESQFAKWARIIVGTGVVEGLDVAASSGMVIACAAGVGIVRGVYYENTASKTLTVSASPSSGQTRLDYVIMKLDFSANAVTVVMKAGTANGSGGALPALTQNDSIWEHPIAVITVVGGSASIPGGNIAKRLADVGQRVVTYPDAASKPTPTVPVALGVNTTTKVFELWVSGAWVSLNQSVAWADVTGKPVTFPPTTPIDAATVSGHKFSVQSTAPASPADGDVWFQTT